MEGGTGVIFDSPALLWYRTLEVAPVRCGGKKKKKNSSRVHEKVDEQDS